MSKEINVGDRVVVVANGKLYPGYSRMAELLHLSDWIADRDDVDDGDTGIVVSTYEDGYGYVYVGVQLDNRNGRQVIMGSSGLKRTSYFKGMNKIEVIKEVRKYLGNPENSGKLLRQAKRLTEFFVDGSPLEDAPKEPKKMWVNLYKLNNGDIATGSNLYETEQDAKQYNSPASLSPAQIEVPNV